MLLHDFTIALRRIASQRLYSAVGVIVLALGLVCFIAAYMFVSYLRGYDRSFANVGRTYVIEQSLSSAAAGIDLPFGAASALLLAEQMRLDVPELAAAARYARRSLPVTFGEQSAPRMIGYVEAPFFEIFDFDLVAGDPRAAAEPRTAVVTRRTAQQIFGTGDAVGKTLTIGDTQPIDVTVAAVIEDVPAASHLASGSMFAVGFDLLVSWDVFEAIGRTQFDDSWGNTPVITYALLPADGSFTAAALNDRFPGIVARHVPPQLSSYLTIGFEARPISSIAAGNLQAQFQGFYGKPWVVDVLGALSIFAAAVLAIACLNFVNLATAQASGRGLDVGTRKAVGATSAQVIRQDLVQTALVVSAAVLVALAAIAPVARLLSGPWQAPFAAPWTQPRFWAFLVALAVGVTLVAGLYPALVLARIRPVAALRLGAARSGPKLLRTLLVGAQFATASLLVAVVIVLFAQRSELREKLLGRFADQYLTFYIGPPGPVPDRELLARELARGPGIKGASYAFAPPWWATGPRTQVRRTADDQAPRLNLDQQYVGYDYFSLLEIPLIVGRVFERERADDVGPQTAEEVTARQGRPGAIVLDRAAARALGWPNPADALGEVVQPFGGPAAEIIGVVESVPMTIRTRGSAGMSYVVWPTVGNQWIVRLGHGDVAASLAHIRDVVRTLAPGQPPPNLLFFDQGFENAYWTFALMNRVLGTLALFAITIAAIGLFGMASYLTARRTREIGVRKTQGASSVAILRLLLWDFSKPVVVANVVAWPFAFYVAERYLGVFAQRIALTPLPFALALLATLALAWLAVGGRVLRAARVNPTRALRHE